MLFDKVFLIGRKETSQKLIRVRLFVNVGIIKLTINLEDLAQKLFNRKCITI